MVHIGRYYPIHGPARRLIVAAQYPWLPPTEFIWATTENYIGLVAAFPWPTSLRLQQPPIIDVAARTITWEREIHAAGLGSCVWQVIYGLTVDGLSNFLRWSIYWSVPSPTPDVFNVDVTAGIQSAGLWKPDIGYLPSGLNGLCPTGTVTVLPVRWTATPPPLLSQPW